MYGFIVNKLKNLNPLSIFIYGSCATNSKNSKSDCEIGVIFDEKNYTKKNVIDNLINNKNYKIYPFKNNDLKEYDIDTPFEKNIYIYSLISGGAKTIFGQKIIENLTLPNIDKHNLLADIYFNLGYLLSAYRLFKFKNNQLSYELFYKAILFTTRDLIFFKTKKFVNGYNNIYKQSKKIIDEDNYNHILKLAIDLRNEKDVTLKENDYLDGISYINKYIVPIIKE